MKSHYHCVYDMKFHLVLKTKRRENCLTSEVLEALNEICLDHCQRWEVELIEFNGQPGYVDLVVGLNPTIEPAKFINSLKTVTSRLIRKRFDEHLKSYYSEPVLWARAYCLLAAGEGTIEKLNEYIQNQDRPT
jgi:putative transposase